MVLYFPLTLHLEGQLAAQRGQPHRKRTSGLRWLVSPPHCRPQTQPASWSIIRSNSFSLSIRRLSTEYKDWLCRRKHNGLSDQNYRMHLDIGGAGQTGYLFDLFGIKRYWHVRQKWNKDIRWRRGGGPPLMSKNSPLLGNVLLYCCTCTLPWLPKEAEK